MDKNSANETPVADLVASNRRTSGKSRPYAWVILILALIAGGWFLTYSLTNAFADHQTAKVEELHQEIRSQRIAECEAVDATFTGSLRHGHCALDDGTLIDPEIATSHRAP